MIRNAAMPPRLAGSDARLRLLVAVCLSIAPIRAQAQNRGTYPLGMSATNSGVTPAPGFSYSNQLLFYSRDHAKDDDGNTLAVTGNNWVLMDINSLAWVSQKKVVSGARYSAATTVPFARNDLASDIDGEISGGGGYADSYHMPLILSWSGERTAVRVMYGFVAPTGRFVAGADDNVGSGYWTHALSTAQTLYLSQTFTFSAYEMYEFHTTQEGTGVHPGQTFDLDYSLMASVRSTASLRLQVGLVGYEAWQTTAKTGPDVTPEESKQRYAVNALGFAVAAAFPRRRISLTLKYFDEFANRSSYEGYSVQATGAISF